MLQFKNLLSLYLAMFPVLQGTGNTLTHRSDQVEVQVCNDTQLLLSEASKDHLGQLLIPIKERVVLAQTEIRQLINSYDHPTSDSVRHL